MHFLSVIIAKNPLKIHLLDSKKHNNIIKQMPSHYYNCLFQLQGKNVPIGNIAKNYIRNLTNLTNSFIITAVTYKYQIATCE